MVSSDIHYGMEGTHQVRQQTKTAQVAHTRLRRLCLLLPTHDRNERDVDERKVVGPHPELELAHGFDEGGRLDIADRASQLGPFSSSPDHVDREPNRPRLHRRPAPRPSHPPGSLPRAPPSPAPRSSSAAQSGPSCRGSLLFSASVSSHPVASDYKHAPPGQSHTGTPSRW